MDSPAQKWHAERLAANAYRKAILGLSLCQLFRGGTWEIFL